MNPPSATADPQHIFRNAPRGGLRGAPAVTTDATLEKSFNLTERWRFDLRDEFYNLLPYAIFNTPGFTFGNADFGVVFERSKPERRSWPAG